MIRNGIDITKVDIRCCDDLMVEDECINFAYELWFDVEKYFGVTLNDTSWINFYTNWYPDGSIKAVVVIDKEDTDEEIPFELDKEEQEFFRDKMEKHSKNLYEMSLKEIWEEAKFSDKDKAFVKKLREADMLISGNYELEVDYIEEKEAWYARAYCETEGCSIPMYNTKFEDEPLILDSETTEMDIYKCFYIVGCSYVGK